ncbi:2-aminoadipate transaminase [Amphibacillus marinus]|uniref:2-aminoadipate transaminase n=1 Tax=Amphibacillus marinus TaxID=872970 RepID=A0A1H8INI0_9BACI|nr:PLP-dependent aminotransferase family protein [Amphibacillus marinus]SEN69586.1 2-aminoadipate transaminase [Amphibacillus marinus]
MHHLKPFQLSNRFSDSIKAVGSAFAKKNRDLISLAYGFPAPETFPISALVQASATALQEEGTSALQYTGGPGRHYLPTWVTERAKLRQIEATPEQVLITNGSMHAIELAIRTLTSEGDQVWIEAPSFFGAVRMIELAGVSIREFPVDQHGLDVDLIEQALLQAINQQKPLPKVLYIIPNYHNPTGVTLSLERRKRLAELAYRYNFFIVEDDAYVDLSFDQAYLPAVYKFAPERTIYVSTFSKIIAPGVRLGWAIGNQEVIQYMGISKSDGATNVLSQEIVANFLQNLDLDQHLGQITTLYQQRCQTMIQAINFHFGSEVSYTIPSGGFFIWLTFPKSIDTKQLQLACLEQGVSFLAGEDFYYQAREHNHVRLCFTFSNEALIKQAIKIIADVYHERRHHLSLLEEVR